MGDTNISTIQEGISLFSGDPFVDVPVAKQIQVPLEGRGWAYFSIVTAAHASDTTTVVIHGKLNASDSYKILKQSDQSTSTSDAQSAGGAVSKILTTQLMPYMKVVLSGTSTSGASTKVWLEAKALAARSDS